MQKATIFERLKTLIPDLEQFVKSELGSARASHAPSQGYMDLHLDLVNRECGHAVIALGHYWRHDSGDMIADPDMEIRVSIENAEAEALSFQQDLPPVYHCIYENGKLSVSERTRHSLNEFLAQWLFNCIQQGHSFNAETAQIVEG